MNKIIRIAILFFSAIVLSCTHEELVTTQETQVCFTIPIDKAISEFNNFIMGFSTKAQEENYTGEIQDVVVICGPSGVDTLLYVVNFADDSGYAVLAADKRIHEKVLMFSESGNIDPSLFRVNQTKSGDGIDPIFQDTIDFYREQYNDIVVGGTEETGEAFVSSHLVKYAQAVVGSNGEVGWVDDTPYLADGTVPNEWQEPINIQYTTDMIVSILLKTQWHQRAPYNNLVPAGKAAGCVPIALAQIIVYNQFPQYFEVNDCVMNWNTMSQQKNVPVGTQEAEMASQLVRYIQLSCNSWLLSGGTFTFPKKAENFLNFLGYENVERVMSYDETKMFQSLENGYPVFLAGAEDHNVFSSHAWVVDGWYKSYVHYDMKDKISGQVSGPYTAFRGDYIHCNWGNNNSAWVTAGVFVDGEDEYNSMYRMITYEVPEFQVIGM